MKKKSGHRRRTKVVRRSRKNLRRTVKRKSVGKGRRRPTRRYSRVQRGGYLEEEKRIFVGNCKRQCEEDAEDIYNQYNQDINERFEEANRKKAQKEEELGKVWNPADAAHDEAKRKARIIAMTNPSFQLGPKMTEELSHLKGARLGSHLGALDDLQREVLRDNYDGRLEVNTLPNRDK